jgi:hypothetical protein
LVDPTGANNTANVTASSTLAAYPDLTVANLRQPTSGLLSGGTLLVQWDNANQAAAGTSSSWYDRVTVRNVTTSETLLSTAVLYDPAAGGTRNSRGSHANRFTRSRRRTGRGKHRTRSLPTSTTTCSSSTPRNSGDEQCREHSRLLHDFAVS